MHHFGEDSTEVKPHREHYELIFTNKKTGQKITMNVPRTGVFDNPNKVLEENQARNLASDIAHRLRDILN
jgi:hypothetical protein